MLMPFMLLPRPSLVAGAVVTVSIASGMALGMKGGVVLVTVAMAVKS